MENTGINDAPFEGVDTVDFCDSSSDDSGVLTLECYFTDVEIDSSVCSSAGGRATRLSQTLVCDEASVYKGIDHMSYCLHYTCDIGEYADWIEDGVETSDDDFLATCEYDVSVSDDPDTTEIPTSPPTGGPTVPSSTAIATSICPPMCTMHFEKQDCDDAGCVWLPRIARDFSLRLPCDAIEKNCTKFGCS